MKEERNRPEWFLKWICLEIDPVGNCRKNQMVWFRDLAHHFHISRIPHRGCAL
ncbi:putative equilibrative nucleotide transporter 1 [Iris pallida]|uniref:Equilibrative nucleotide transporter 1 n=1 Tax=Iris pallida TaxID=29817 RepID=A0AAX6F4N8_IRIPA|nr:putative equilibrative nucleotide transporter 1 [Iris pallida]KAJ6853544.1 putative equilibrative nucleotide transporter 1 [Iris pallida]